MLSTGRVVEAKVEADGDIHIALEDATGNNVGTVSAEIPVGPRWCEIRQTVFGWTTQKFPFQRQDRAHAENARAACHHGDVTISLFALSQTRSAKDLFSFQ